MNILDVIILIVTARYLIKKKNRRFVHTFLNSVAVLSGYLIGFFISIAITRDMEFYIDKGVVALLLMFNLAILLRVMLAIVRRIVGIFREPVEAVVDEAPVYKNTNIRLEGNILVTKDNHNPELKRKLSTFEKLNKWLAIPYRFVFFIVSIYIMSQTLFYIPIQLFQFTIQGSGLMMASAQILPDSGLSEMAKQFNQNEFVKGRIDYKLDFAGSGEFRNAVMQVSPSIVQILTSKCGGFTGGMGSGSVIAPGLVVTNKHVVNGSSSIFIVNHYGSYPATIISIDSDHDIAIIYSKYLDTNSQPIKLSSTGAVVGQDAVSVGYPSDTEGKFSSIVGEIKNNSVKSLNTKLDSSTTFLLTKGLGPGSSGGPVLNSNGEIIGMNVAGGGGLIAINADLINKSIEKAKAFPFPAFSLMCEYTARSY